MKTKLSALAILLLTAFALPTRAATSVSIVTLTWDDPNPPELQVVKYTVSGKRSEATDWQSFGEVSEKTVKLINLTPGTWIFTVTAVNNLGVSSPASEPSAALVVSPPVIPVAAINVRATITYTIEVP